jgi:tetratricopeptide (TPR) repeat protein
MGAEHPNVARLTFNMAELHKQLGDFDKSKTEYRRSIDLMEKAFGPDHPEVGRALNNLASVEYDGGEYESSLQHYAASLNVVEKAMGSDYSGLGYPLTGLGLVYLATDRPSEAIDPLERSLRLRVGEDVDPVDRADTQYALARARWQTGELTRAHTLVHAAIDAYEHAAPGVRTNLDEANAWLRSHPLP